mmetsp:Transcript_34210/g.110274  ORF Transcript_34210/g.110274 Transcript_34210/m.110274 type:complete len:200 (+) Transcript_34210:1539-2138(+)
MPRLRRLGRRVLPLGRRRDAQHRVGARRRRGARGHQGGDAAVRPAQQHLPLQRLQRRHRRLRALSRGATAGRALLQRQAGEPARVSGLGRSGLGRCSTSSAQLEGRSSLPLGAGGPRVAHITCRASNASAGRATPLARKTASTVSPARRRWHDSHASGAGRVAYRGGENADSALVPFSHHLVDASQISFWGAAPLGSGS